MIPFSIFWWFFLGFLSIASAGGAIDAKIVGGQDAQISNFPYQCSLEHKGSHICGCSILRTQTIVTAAHCCKGMDKSSLQIRAGSQTVGQGTARRIKTMQIHPDYNTDTLDNDVCVLTLKQPLIFGRSIQPIKLATVDPADGATCYVSGWGYLREGGDVSTKLQYVKIEMINKDTCKDWYSSFTITEQMICAGVPSGGKDACQGDSGGPLICNGILVGVVSWGSGCARAKYPTVYASMAKLRGFISSSMLAGSSFNPCTDIEC